MTTKQPIVHKYKLILLFIILLLLLGGSILCLKFFPPRDKKDSLQILQLRQNALPVFHIESELTYTKDLASRIQYTLQGDGSHRDGGEPSPLVPLVQTLAEGEPSPKVAKAIQVKALNIQMIIDGNTEELVDTLEQLTLLTTYASKLKVSLIPSNKVSEEQYFSYCHSLTSQAKENDLSSIEFIWYPKDSSKLNAYDEDTIKSIGVILNSTEDFEQLALVYKHFLGNKKLYVQENIQETFSNDIMLATKQINAVYYTLAVKFPGFHTIFSPYIRPPFKVDNTFSIKDNNANFKYYYAIYNRLLEKPWVTTKSVELSSDSPYTLVDSYTNFSEKIELLLSPDSDILPNLPGKAKTSSKASYIRYRWNETPLNIQMYYPYSLQLDTTQYANGVTRLKALSYDDKNSLIEVQSIDLSIYNPISSIRSPRIDITYPKEDKTIYTSKYIPVLMYHSITNTVAKEDENSSVETSVFESQIKALVDNGFTPINFKHLKDYLNGIGGLPDKPILITMDDGYLDNYINAYPIYKKYNVQATLFVSSYFMRDENTERHFGWKAATEMESSGLIDIQSHGYDHTAFPYLSLKDLRYHITRSKGLIEQHLGARDVFVVACPQFRNTPSTRHLLSSLDVDFQITKLAKRGTVLNTSNLRRINVPNTMSPDALIAKLDELTK